MALTEGSFTKYLPLSKTLPDLLCVILYMQDAVCLHPAHWYDMIRFLSISSPLPYSKAHLTVQ